MANDGTINCIYTYIYIYIFYCIYTSAALHCLVLCALHCPIVRGIIYIYIHFSTCVCSLHVHFFSKIDSYTFYTHNIIY